MLFCENGKNVTIQLNGQSINLIITELYLSEMSRIEFIKEIRTMPKYEQTHILSLTSESQTDKKGSENGRSFKLEYATVHLF